MTPDQVGPPSKPSLINRIWGRITGSSLRRADNVQSSSSTDGQWHISVARRSLKDIDDVSDSAKIAERAKVLVTQFERLTTGDERTLEMLEKKGTNIEILVDNQ